MKRFRSWLTETESTIPSNSMGDGGIDIYDKIMKTTKRRKKRKKPPLKNVDDRTLKDLPLGKD